MVSDYVSHIEMNGIQLKQPLSWFASQKCLKKSCAHIAIFDGYSFKYSLVPKFLNVASFFLRFVLSSVVRR